MNRNERTNINRLERQVEDITEHIEQLTIERQRLNNELEATIDELRRLRRTQRRHLRQHTETTRQARGIESPVVPERHYTTVERPRLGDHVRIINPRPGQLTTGVIQGFCSDGKVKVFRTGYTVVTRLPKNVALIRRHE